MIEAFLVAAILMCLAMARKKDFLSPAMLFSLAAAMSLVVFYVVEYLGVYPAVIRSYWQVRRSFQGTGVSVAGFYAALVSMGFLANLSTTRIKPYAGSRPLFLRKSPADKFLFKLTSSPFAIFGLVLLFSFVLLHLFTVDHSAILHYRQYLQIRNPAEAGIHNPVLAAVHVNLPLMACLAGPMAVIYFLRRRMVLCLLAGFVLAYGFIISVSFGSRFAVLQLLAIALMLHVLSRRKRYILVFTLVTSAVLVYGVLISLRLAAAVTAIGDFGLLPSLQAAAHLPQLFFEGMPLFAVFNFFGGAFVMADAFGRAGLAYPVAYKLLSFSPFPSMIDGFGHVRHLEHRVNMFAPFSNFAEAYHFGPGYFVALLLILFVSLIILSRFWQRYRGGFAFFLLAPAYFMFLRMHLYPLRGTFRWLLASLVAVVVFETLMLLASTQQARGRLKPISSRTQAEGPGSDSP